MVKMCISIPGEIYEKLFLERKDTGIPISHIISSALSERYDIDYNSNRKKNRQVTSTRSTLNDEEILKLVNEKLINVIKNKTQGIYLGENISIISEYVSPVIDDYGNEILEETQITSYNIHKANFTKCFNEELTSKEIQEALLKSHLISAKYKDKGFIIKNINGKSTRIIKVIASKLSL